jgi:hypothetical protein
VAGAWRVLCADGSTSNVFEHEGTARAYAEHMDVDFPTLGPHRIEPLYPALNPTPTDGRE